METEGQHAQRTFLLFMLQSYQFVAKTEQVKRVSLFNKDVLDAEWTYMLDPLITPSLVLKKPQILTILQHYTQPMIIHMTASPPTQIIVDAVKDIITIPSSSILPLIPSILKTRKNTFAISGFVLHHEKIYPIIDLQTITALPFFHIQKESL
jgi:hypothetical protein